MSRLKANSDFQRVRREGRSWSHSLVVLIASANGLAETRVGIAAGKTVGGAVKRNRAKRRLREAIRLVAPTLTTGWDVVLVARPALPEAAWPEVVSALSQLIGRAKLQKDG
ncbi:MAG TPA: ribonuclease P protein component [Anaerolineales bacterium]|nr:ribonuclease P protein component [Anaerolineales bacterium]